MKTATTINAFSDAREEFGSVFFEGKEYALIDMAVTGGACLPGGYTNYVDAENGEEYDFDMCAHAIDLEGNEYTVEWLFSDTKGEEEKELDDFDYTTANRVELFREAE